MYSNPAVGAASAVCLPCTPDSGNGGLRDTNSGQKVLNCLKSILMSKVYFREIFEYPITEFKKHFENNENERIIFSGKYGIGKTRFLQDFFFEEENQVLYEAYRLFPVNYSISKNEDILEYIKYDILIELLLKRSSIEDFDLDYLETLPVYLQKNLFKIIPSILAMLPLIGKSISEFSDKFDTLKKKFIEFHEKSNTTESDIVTNFLNSLESKEGSLFENNAITKIISDTIKKNSTKKSVLIVDDIDRLDPEHVFRILNVFATHFENTNTLNKNNKFNFDKIIIVCDFHNIRNLFHHRYGNEIDFMGYIDKFYSSDIYYFDNKKAIFKILDKIFRSIQYTGNEDDHLFISQLYLKNDFIKNLSLLLLNRSVISLRSLVRLYGKKINYHLENIFFEQSREIIGHKIPIAIQLKVVRDLLGDYDNMRRVFETFLKNGEPIENYENIFGLLMYIITSNEKEFPFQGTRSDVNTVYKNKKLLIEVNLEFSTDRLSYVNVYEHKENSNVNLDRGMRLNASPEMFWQAMLDTIKKLNQLGFLT